MSLFGTENVVYHYNPTSNRNGVLLNGKRNNVVYHYNPTSNRNSGNVDGSLTLVVYHYNPTSNRNFEVFFLDF